VSERKAWDHGPRASRHKRGYGKEHERIRAELLRDVIYCEHCRKRNDAGRFTLGTVADHIVPLAKGGTGDRSNYQLLCRSCATTKDLLDKGSRKKRLIGHDGWFVEE
jgi:5-methylcytosine-specific restriction protein A